MKNLMMAVMVAGLLAFAGSADAHCGDCEGDAPKAEQAAKGHAKGHEGHAHAAKGHEGHAHAAKGHEGHAHAAGGAADKAKAATGCPHCEGKAEGECPKENCEYCKEHCGDSTEGACAKCNKG